MTFFSVRIRSAALWTLLCLWPLALHSQVVVNTAQYNNARTGANLSETILNTGNVNASRFGKLFSRAVDDSVYALPLYIPNVAIPGKGTHNVVYIATMNNTVYAFDADDPAQSAPLWVRNVGPAFPINGVLNGVWFQTNWGILGTPVISSNTMYFVAYIQFPGSAPSLYMCAINITTGADQFGPPAEILFPKQGGFVKASPATIQRAGLLVASNNVYVGFANFETTPGTLATQEGFLYAYALNDISQPVSRFQVTNSQGGGIWQAGRGLAADSSGDVYVVVGDGFYDGVTQFGGSLLKFAAPLQLVEWFSPADWLFAYQNDLDLGANGALLVPGTDYLITAGKEGVLYLLRQSRLGRLQVNSSGGPVEQFHATNGCHLNECGQNLSMAYWDRTPNPTLYLWDRGDVLRAFPFNGARLQTHPSAVSSVSSAMPGGISVSANGTVAGSGIVWAITTDQLADAANVPGTFRAFDAADVSRELWNSNLNPTRDAMGTFTKFTSPVVVNGKVYVVTQSNQLQVYGLLF